MAQRIEVKGLDVYYGSFRAVADVSMVIEPRSVTALIGPSGCGKSTFLRTLNRMHEVVPGARVDGTVLVDGVSYTERGLDELSDLEPGERVLLVGTLTDMAHGTMHGGEASVVGSGRYSGNEVSDDDPWHARVERMGAVTGDPLTAVGKGGLLGGASVLTAAALMLGYVLRRRLVS